MSDEIMETEVGTEATATESQGKMFSQSELDRIVADRIAREQRKFEKQLSGIDISEARQQQNIRMGSGAAAPDR